MISDLSVLQGHALLFLRLFDREKAVKGMTERGKLNFQKLYPTLLEERSINKFQCSVKVNKIELYTKCYGIPEEEREGGLQRNIAVGDISLRFTETT